VKKAMHEQRGNSQTVSIEAEVDRIIIRAKKQVTQGWELAFQTMEQKSDDALLDKEFLSAQSAWDKSEWKW